MSDDALAVLPSSMGKDPRTQGAPTNKRQDPSKFIPVEKGALLLKDPKAEECPYTFSESPVYLAKQRGDARAKRTAELEGAEETRGFMASIEELAKKHNWDEAYNILERRTVTSSGLFLVTRALLRWKSCKYRSALWDAENAVSQYGSSAKAGPLASALACFMRLCLGSEARSKDSCSKSMREFVNAWEQADQRALETHVLGQGLFHPQRGERIREPVEVVDGIEAVDGVYLAAPGIHVGFTFMKNLLHLSAPVLIHYHGSNEVASQYRTKALAEKYRDLPAHLLVVDYRGYGWSDGNPSLSTFLRDAEPLMQKLPEILIQRGFTWPYYGGVVASGRSLGAQVAMHVATMFPNLFSGLILDSALATSATGDRLGKTSGRASALDQFGVELEASNLESLRPLRSDIVALGSLDKIRTFEGNLLLLHGLSDDLVPHDGSESLLAAARTSRKELVLIDGAGHSNIGQFEQFWASKRQFLLKIQLEDRIPAVGASVERFCPVCAEKAESKCSRCKKVWYCGREHQAKHWKTHKLLCAGGPPEPKETVIPEGEACIVCFVVADISNDEDVKELSRSLTSLASQDAALNSICVNWHASTPELANAAGRVLEEMHANRGTSRAFAMESPKSLAQFERIKSLLDAAPVELVPSHSWIKVVDLGDIWSAEHAAALIQTLRRAAPDQRIVAVCCPTVARLKTAEGGAEGPSDKTLDPSDVAAAISQGTAAVETTSWDLQLSNLASRQKHLKDFVATTPVEVLRHNLSGFRFQRKLMSTFGKKVQTMKPDSDREWMRLPSSSSRSTVSAGPNGSDGPIESSAADTARATVLHDAYLKATASEKKPTPTQAILTCESLDSTVRACSVLRRRIERIVVIQAGEKVANKELKTSSLEEVHNFLEEVGLSHVIGIERWVRETAEQIVRGAANEFQVILVE